MSENRTVNIVKEIAAVLGDVSQQEYGQIINLVTDGVKKEEVAQIINLIRRRKTNFDTDIHKHNMDVLQKPSLIDKYYNLEKKNITSMFDNHDPCEMQRQFNEKTQLKSACVALNTSAACQEVGRQTVFRWVFSVSGAKADNTINVLGNIRDIVGMRALPMKLTVSAAPSKSYAADNASVDITEPWGFQYKNTFVNRNNAYTVLISEFSSQANMGRDGRKFHFSYFPQLMNPETVSLSNFTLNRSPASPYYEMLTSGRGNGWFWFKKPITDITGLSISIADPFEFITITNATSVIVPIVFFYLKDVEGNTL